MTSKSKNTCSKLSRHFAFDALERRELMAADFSSKYLFDMHDIGGAGEIPIIRDFNGDGKDGGPGVDSAYLVQAGNAVKNLEQLQMRLPGGHPQGVNTCGPNSAWRVMHACGGTATEQQIISAANRESLVSSIGLRTAGEALTLAMNSNARGLGDKRFTMQTGKSVEDVIELLKKGKPVVALIGIQDSGRAIEGTAGQIVDKIFGSEKKRAPSSMPNLHWIAFSGYDLNRKLIYFTDTDRKSYQQSYSAFNSQLRWRFDDASQMFLKSLGVKSGTIIS